ncbi:MAG: hypothetical protein H6806_01745 [Planctomycetes bacterium]|nr:hypothetical protein [Planctomycetota bacterium]MCB9824242.1 hypothetical protein [Planctomycetota bacterium]MCB9828473.1 hypothetical protein [Planctomycetota bacterium]MCB9900240.1 hypothetical protein [Planctomycetota bacterium]
MTWLLAHAAVTLLLTGLIWTVQIVHYPLMDGIGTEAFVAWHRRHTRAITWLVGPLMLAELGLAIALPFLKPAGVPEPWTWLGLALLLQIHAVTVLVSVPCHERLAEGFDATAHRRLVRSNWLRTLAWTARAGLAIAMVVAASR